MANIARGMILAAERIDDATAVNVSTEERPCTIDAAYGIPRHTEHSAEIRCLKTKTRHGECTYLPELLAER